MTDPLFLTELDEALVAGDLVRVSGEEARHAVAVRRLTIGESVLLGNGRGLGARGTVSAVGRDELDVEVSEVLRDGVDAMTWTVAQALAKGERSELAVQMATELGARGILAWQASRSIVRWQGDRARRSLEKWASTARESAKQSRRLWVPHVEAASTADVCAAIAAADVALVLHEDALTHISQIRPPRTGTGLLIVGPEGGISGDELAGFVEAGARPVAISDAVLRTSTAAAVALGQLDVLAQLP